MNNKQSILESVFNDINNIEWSTEKVKQRALNFITIQSNLMINQYGTILDYRIMSKEYWTKCIGGKTDIIREIKSKLVSNNILEEKTGLGSKDKRTKSYKLNNKYINNINNTKLIYTQLADPFFNELETNNLSELETYTLEQLNTIKIKKGSASLKKGSASINEFIWKVSELNDIKINEEIEDDFITIKYAVNDKGYRYSRENALTEIVENKGMNLIQIKDKVYIYDDVNEFLDLKRKELYFFYKRQLFNLENGIYYVSRNETNNRLDHNLTQLKKDLYDVIEFDGESIKEIDIKNAQFAILSNITTELDESFISNAQNGTLYEYVAKKLNTTRKEAKKLMFNVAFDKVKTKQDIIRNIFPKTMLFVDAYKKENGYKTFSNLLQKYESNLMIDGLLNHLVKLGYNVFTVHDSIKCKESDYNDILNEIIVFMSSNNFKCSFNTNTKEKTNSNDTQEAVTKTKSNSNIDISKENLDAQTETKTDIFFETRKYVIEFLKEIFKMEHTYIKHKDNQRRIDNITNEIIEFKKNKPFTKEDFKEIVKSNFK